MKRVLSFIFILSISLPLLLGNVKLSPYTQHFLKNPLNNKIQKIKKTDNSSIGTVNAFIHINQDINKSTLQEMGIVINIETEDILSAQIPVDQIEALSETKGVTYVEIGVPVRKKMDKGRTVSLVTQVQEGTGIVSPFLGKGVVVGVVDGGFEYGHPAFYTQDKSSYRVKRAWNQNNNRKYEKEIDILTAQFDTKLESHGTHVASIAAGADHSANYWGIAQEADIVLVSYNEKDNSSDNVSISDGVKYVYDYATTVNQPAVVNLSLGTHIGPHDGTSTFDRLMDNLQGPGRLLVGSAGNEGADNLHISKTFSVSSQTLQSFLDFYDPDVLYSEVDVWGTQGKDFTIQVVVYNTSTKKEVYTSAAFNASIPKTNTVSLKSANGAVGSVTVYTGLDPNNQKANAFVVTELTSISGANAIGLIVKSTSGTVHAWADDFYSVLTSNNISGWTDGNSSSSVGEIGGTGKRIISVGAFTTKSSIVNTKGATQRNGETVNEIASFSSKGPTADERVKPAISAPGAFVAAAFSSAVLSDQYYKDLFVQKIQYNGKDYYYGAIQGTSMSSPFVTGVLASWLEAKKDLNPEEVKEIFKTTAIRDAYTGDITGDGSNTWGQGKIDAYNGIKAVLNITATEDNPILNQQPAVRVYSTSASNDFKNLFFTKEDTNVTIEICDINGRVVYQEFLPSVGVSDEMPLNFSQKGIYLIQVTGLKNRTTSKVIF